MGDNGHLLAATNISKVYSGRKVVDSVSIYLRSGEIVGLLGPNGAGKTTTFYTCVGLIAPTSGQVFLDEEDITRQPMYMRARLGIGYLPQEPSVFRKLTVRENVLSILETMPFPTHDAREERLHDLLVELGVDDLQNNLASSLSGGERRRVEISRALARSPHFILLDEPFAGIDPIAVNDIQQIISRLCEKGIGILITDHNVRETLDICEKAYIVSEGHIIAEGTAEVILSNAKVRKVYLGENFRL